MIHTIFAALFVIAFAVSLGLFAAGAVTKTQHLLKWGAWGFLCAFLLFLVVYGTGFPLKHAILSSSAGIVTEAAEKHHRMSKFVLTGCVLISAACTVVLFKFRDQAYPNWFSPNLLFLCLMLFFFLLRSLITGFGIGWAEKKHQALTQLEQEKQAKERAPKPVGSTPVPPQRSPH